VVTKVTEKEKYNINCLDNPEGGLVCQRCKKQYISKPSNCKKEMGFPPPGHPHKEKIIYLTISPLAGGGREVKFSVVSVSGFTG
jgi:hypothetical protein